MTGSSKNSDLPAATLTEVASAELRPVTPSKRISSIDCLRGFAVLGILLINIPWFGIPETVDPTSRGNATTLNLAAWAASVVADGTPRAIFAMLFGAGVVILTTRADARGQGANVADVYYRRLFWLFLFGWVHDYLLFGIDYLQSYALLGVGLYPLRKLSPGRLILTGIICLTLCVCSIDFLHHFQKRQTAAEGESQASAKDATQHEEERIRQAIEDRQSGYITWVKRTLGDMVSDPPFYLRVQFWDRAGAMVLGMGLFKLGVFSASSSVRVYLAMVVLGYGLGFLYRGFGIYSAIGSDFASGPFPAPFGVLRLTGFEVSRVLIAMGHVGLMMIISKNGWCRTLMAALAAVGRLALSNYILQTIVCTLVFYGFGLGLYGQLELYQLYFVVGLTWTGQLVLSTLWIRYFRFGPLEWIWRSLTYWKRQPMLSKAS